MIVTVVDIVVANGTSWLARACCVRESSLERRMGALRVTVARYAETIHVLCAPRGVLGAALCSCLWVGGKGPSVDRSNMRDVWGSV